MTSSEEAFPHFGLLQIDKTKRSGIFWRVAVVLSWLSSLLFSFSLFLARFFFFLSAVSIWRYNRVAETLFESERQSLYV